MPSKDTFGIKPISELIWRWIENRAVILDPFCNGNRICPRCITNDLNPDLPADYHLDALDFLRDQGPGTVDLALFDPPYSPRQVSECYKSLGKTVNMQTTQASYCGKLKDEISRVIKKDGACITFGWNSGGIGKTKGFEIQEILMVAHGAGIMILFVL